MSHIIEYTYKPNMIELSYGSYVVRTQAGFTKAKKHFDPHNELVENKLPYPTTYPSVVTFSSYYKGAYYLDIICVPLNDYIIQLRNLLQLLEDQ